MLLLHFSAGVLLVRRFGLLNRRRFLSWSKPAGHMASRYSRSAQFPCRGHFTLHSSPIPRIVSEHSSFKEPTGSTHPRAGLSLVPTCPWWRVFDSRHNLFFFFFLGCVLLVVGGVLIIGRSRGGGIPSTFGLFFNGKQRFTINLS